jgi:cation transport regulator ChaB
MPYTVSDPPDWLKNLPRGAITIGVRVFNSTYRTLKGAESERERKARVAAWSAIKQKYYRTDDGKWKPREKQITDPYEIMELVASEGSKASWFYIDIEPNKYIYTRTAMVPFSGSEGIRLEWGKNDATGDWDLVTVWFDDSIYTRNAAQKMIDKNKNQMMGDQYKPKSLSGMFSAKSLVTDVLDAKQQVVYAELYVPWETDTQGHFASDFDVEAALEDFMARHAKGETKGVGIEHKIFEDVGEIVQGFVAREGDKTFTPGAAVLGIRCTDTTWSDVQDEKLNGLSMSGKWDMIPIVPADEASKGIWQLTNIRIDEPSLVLKGAIRRGFKLYKSGAEADKENDTMNGEEGSKAEWTRKFINSLPDAAFAYVEKAYRDGDTKNKNARHAPHHNANVRSATEKSSVDLPHLRNALARVNQLKSVTGESNEMIQSKAKAHLMAHAKQWGVGEFAKTDDVDIDSVIAQLDEMIESGTTSASGIWWLKKRGGGKAMNRMDLKTAKDAILRVLKDAVGEKSELEKISADDLEDAKATASIINGLIDSVNGLTGSMKSINENLETIKSMVSDGKGGKQEPGAAGEEKKPAEEEKKPGEAEEKKPGEGEEKPNEEKPGEEKVSEEEAAKSIKAVDIVHSFREVGALIGKLNDRLDAVENARGVSMQDLLKAAAGSKSAGGNGDGEVYHSSILGCDVPMEVVNSYRESSRPKK